MSEKFTPGPWEAKKINTNDRGYRRSTPNDREIVSATGIVPCFVFGEGNGGLMRDELKANAHLIAAAPDMYEALEFVMRLSGDYVSEHPAISEKVNAAMAKARGEA